LIIVLLNSGIAIANNYNNLILNNIKLYRKQNNNINLKKGKRIRKAIEGLQNWVNIVKENISKGTEWINLTEKNIQTTIYYCKKYKFYWKYHYFIRTNE